jgi:copper chaperone
MTTATYTAPAISCQHCQHTIESALGALTGVESVHVDIPSKRVDVQYDPTQVDESKLLATLDEEGFPVAR